MANKVVIFPVSAEAAARAYAAWTDNNNPFTQPAPADNSGSWAYVRRDAFDQWVVPYLGPPFAWNTVEFAEPPGGAAMRAAGVLHDYAVWPAEEDA
jgi:hypothetical protein